MTEKNGKNDGTTNGAHGNGATRSDAEKAAQARAARLQRDGLGYSHVKNGARIPLDIKRNPEERKSQAETLREKRSLRNELEKEKTKRLEAEALLTIDPMTGLHNRAGWDQELAMTLMRLQRNARTRANQIRDGLSAMPKDQPVTVAFFDLDKFKSINSAFGHPGGDAAIIHAANVLKTTLRPTDYVAHWGGDEFGAILPNTDATAAKVAINRVKEAVANTPCRFNEQTIPLSTSCGVLQLTAEDTMVSVNAKLSSLMGKDKPQAKTQVEQLENRNTLAVTTEPSSIR